MQNFFRGNVYWVDLEPTFGSQQKGRRPCLVMTANKINERRRTVGVIPLSTSPKVAPPIVIALPSLGENTVAICDQLRAVDKSKLGEHIAVITKEELSEIEKCMKLIFVLN